MNKNRSYLVDAFKSRILRIFRHGWSETLLLKQIQLQPLKFTELTRDVILYQSEIESRFQSFSNRTSNLLPFSSEVHLTDFQQRESNVRVEFDVIIVGGGGSGLAAAVRALEMGASVLVLEKQAQLGGTTGMAIGSFTANGTRMQREANISDNADDHEVDAGQFAIPEIEAQNNPTLRRFFLGQTAETLEWLRGMGLYFHGPNPEPPNRVPRMHNIVPNAKAYIAAFQAQILKRKGTIVCDAPVLELVIEDQEVTGVIALIQGARKTIKAKRGVVLAAGDYANAPELIGRFKGDRFTSIEGVNPKACGDGHLLAEKVGARLLNMDITYGPELRFVPPPGDPFEQLIPTSGFLAKLMGQLVPFMPQALINWRIKRLLLTWQHPENSLFDDGAILVNSEGRRFCNEKDSPQREIAISEQPGKAAFILLDERIAAYYSQWPHFISTAPKIAYAYVNNYLKLRPDVSVEGTTLDAVGQARNLNVQHLNDSIEQFNQYIAGQKPDAFGRTHDSHALTGNRWVLLGPAKAYFTTTEGGVAINQQLQALNDSGHPIPGLYAIGCNGMGGQILWGHGLHIAWAITSGRLVGEYLGKSKIPH
ncbi:Fumarate reductase flavoprotein subunit precursor [Gimesia aquarii]|uniref:Fumarate reductase flavoprotein subunit n=1 Tax=Gimesia aquarii TaxID=2527964 RepID=A0A517VQX6_9PLAN|nr:Fumarate reductase flavoprotein subunit precursor [Gimesia aquarii]